MGLKRQRPPTPPLMKHSLSLAVLALALTSGENATAYANATTVVRAEGASLRWQHTYQYHHRVLQESESAAAGVVHPEAALVAAAAENREGSAGAEPSTAPQPSTTAPVTETPKPSETPAPSATTTAPTTPPPTTTAPTTTPPPTTAAPTTAPTPTPTVAPSPKASEETPSPTPSVPATSDTPAPTTQTPAPSGETPAPTTQTPAPTTQTPAPTTQTPAPTSAPPAPTTAPPAPTTAPPAPTTAPPAPTTAPPAPTTAPPAPTTAAPVTTAPAPPTSAPPATTAPAPPAPTAPAPTTAAPATTKPAPAPAPAASPTLTPTPTTVKPSSTPTPTPALSPTPTPSPTPTLATKAPTPSTQSPSSSGGAGAGSGSSAKTDGTGNGKVSAPDLTPISGSGVISKSDKEGSNSGASDSASNRTKNASDEPSKLSTLAIAGIILGVVASVIVAVFFVHARRRRSDREEKEFDTGRQRQLDALFAQTGAPPVPMSSHPGAASIASSNGMTIVAAPASLTPRGQIPIASSHRFKRGASGAGPGSKGRFTDRVLSEGPGAFKGRMDSIPQSPRQHSSDFDESEDGHDSFLGSQGYVERSDSDRSGYSVRTSSNGTSNGDYLSTGPRSTGATSYVRGSSDSRPLYFPAGMPQPRSSMVELGLATTGPVPMARASLSEEFFDSLPPRGTSGEILRPLAHNDDTYTDYSVSSDEYDTRNARGDSNVSSSSNPNPWAITGSEADLSSRGFSMASSAAMTDLPTSTRSDDSAFSDLPTSGRSDESFYDSEYDSDTQRSNRSDSYGYVDPRSTGQMSNRSFLSFSSDGTGTGTTPGRYSLEVEEGHI